MKHKTAWVIVFGLVGIWLVSGLTKAPPSSSTDGTAAPAPAAQVAATKSVGDPECQKRWLKAEKGGVTYGEGMVDGHMAVMVDEAAYQSIDYRTKVGMAETFQCATVGKGQALTEVRFISNMTGKVLAVWAWNKLTVN